MKPTKQNFRIAFLIILFVLSYSVQSCRQDEKKDKEKITEETTTKLYEQKIEYKAGNPANFPEGLDAVVAAPDNHKVLLENDKVRVLEVTLSPKELEPLHHHKWPSVLYIREAGDFIDRDKDDNIILDTRELAEPLEFPLTMWKDPEAPHWVENLSETKTIRLIRVEMKQ